MGIMSLMNIDFTKSAMACAFLVSPSSKVLAADTLFILETSEELSLEPLVPVDFSLEKLLVAADHKGSQ